MPDLAKHSTNATVVFLGNNGTGIEEYEKYINPERILLGFPGAAGKRDKHVMRVVFDPEKSHITIGGPSGKFTARLYKIKNFFEEAGIPVIVSKNVDAWLKSHIALISPLANAHYMLKSQNKSLLEATEIFDLVANAIIEGIIVLRKLHYPILPKKLRLVRYAPKLLKKKIREIYTWKWFDIAMKGHADHAIDEMRQIAEEFQRLVKKSDISTPAINALYTSIPSPK
ncbi:MAG: hypothetical protein JW776_12535 [Candidatus Lokiarchaeota archaeon]|nr:hypothetical protein [Candidatus Lokiarchaeota archaeon]